MKRLIVLLVLGGIFLGITGCATKPQEGSDESAYGDMLLSQEEIIEALNGDLASLETALQDALKKYNEENEMVTDLVSERDFLTQQLELLQIHYDEVLRRSSGANDPVAMALDELNRNLAEEIEQGYVDFYVYNGVIIIHINNPILFEPGKADLRPENMEILLRISSAFKYFPDRVIRVEGHTATGPDSPRYPTAWELGAARAVNVTRYFQEEAGIAPERLVAVSFGEWRPIASNDTEDGKRINRRIEIVILNRPLYQWQELRLTE